MGHRRACHPDWGHKWSGDASPEQVTSELYIEGCVEISQRKGEVHSKRWLGEVKGNTPRTGKQKVC